MPPEEAVGDLAFPFGSAHAPDTREAHAAHDLGALTPRGSPGLCRGQLGLQLLEGVVHLALGRQRRGRLRLGCGERRAQLRRLDRQAHARTRKVPMVVPNEPRTALACAAPLDEKQRAAREARAPLEARCAGATCLSTGQRRVGPRVRADENGVTRMELSSHDQPAVEGREGRLAVHQQGTAACLGGGGGGPAPRTPRGNPQTRSGRRRGGGSCSPAPPGAPRRRPPPAP
jgi:hypothetical protein